jgi:hypothetical protein
MVLLSDNVSAPANSLKNGAGRTQRGAAIGSAA